jgi:hypothetical protein
VLGLAVLGLAGLSAVVLGLVWVSAQRAGNPVLALVDPSMSGTSVAVRVALIACTALTAGIGLVRALLGLAHEARQLDGPSDSWAAVPIGVRRAAWVASVGAAAACAVAVLTGQASRPAGAIQLMLSLLVPLLLGSARAVAPAALALAGLLAAELASGRAGLAMALDVGYALAAAVLLGASVFGTSAPDRLARVALPASVAACLTGVAQLLLTGPATTWDALHTGSGIAALAQAGLPMLATATWSLTLPGAGAHPRLVHDRPSRVIGSPESAARAERADSSPSERGGSLDDARRRAGELTRLAAGIMTVAFASAATLATLPHPAAAPAPGQPLLRPIDLPFRHLAVLVLPMRPGPNLVHVGGPGEPVRQPLPAAHQHGATTTASTGITVSVGQPADTNPVPVTARPGAAGGWAVVDIPAGADRLTVTADGTAAAVPVNVGTEPADPGEQRLLAGPDGPECAGAVLGALLAAATMPSTDTAAPARATCPAAGLSGADAAALRDTVEFLAARGISALTLVTDDSPRGRAAAELVRADAARRHLPIATAATPGATLLALSGWAGAVEALDHATDRAVTEATGGVVLAPWLLTDGVLRAASSEVVALPFDPGDSGARRYAATLAAAFPGEAPSAAGYLAWAAETGMRLESRSSFYGAAPVNVPMGMDGMDHGGSDPAAWYPGGTVVPINPPLVDRRTGAPGVTP